MNSSITNREVELIISTVPKQRISKVTGEYHQQFKKNKHQLDISSSQNKRRTISQIILWDQCYPDTKTRWRQHRKRKHRAISHINVDIKILNKISVNLIHKKNYVPWPSGIIPGMQGWFNIQKSITVVSSFIISLDALNLFMIRFSKITYKSHSYSYF